jgi:hypothetical protein
VLHGQGVPTNEKLVSLFEPHADIFVKGRRDVQYGLLRLNHSIRAGLHRVTFEVLQGEILPRPDW